MINAESMIEAGHFIMLDIRDTLSGEEFERNYPSVQIIYPPDMNTYQNNRVAESHPENGLTHKESKKYLFTISLNLDTD